MDYTSIKARKYLLPIRAFFDYEKGLYQTGNKGCGYQVSENTHNFFYGFVRRVDHSAVVGNQKGSQKGRFCLAPNFQLLKSSEDVYLHCLFYCYHNWAKQNRPLWHPLALCQFFFGLRKKGLRPLPLCWGFLRSAAYSGASPSSAGMGTL